MATQNGAQTGAQTGAPDLTSLSKLLTQALGQLTASKDDIHGKENEDAREKAVMAAMGILSTLRQATLKDMAMDMSINVSNVMALRAYSSIGAFDHIPLEGDISYADLARKMGAETLLIRRLSWVLVARGALKQHGKDRVAHTAYSKMFVGPDSMGKAMLQVFGDHMTGFMKLPEYFKEYGLREPTGRKNTVFAWAFGHPELTPWEIMELHPEEKKVQNFMLTMQALESHVPLVGTYDFGWLADETARSPNRILFVDVAGSKGHVTKAVLQSNPGIPRNRCVLQDRAEVIETVRNTDDPELKEVQKVVLDFHKSQPTKGALTYFLGRILHDYGDDESVEIMKHIADAMAPDSRLLVGERVMTNPPHPIVIASDFNMMGIGGKERTLEDFGELGSRAGLKVLKLHQSDIAPTAIVEFVKA